MRSSANRLFGIVVLALAVTACGKFTRAYDVTPAGLSRSDDHFRRWLANGAADTALLRFGAKRTPAPTDDLLRALYRGVIAYHAGQYDSSAFLLDRAGLLLEDRDAFRVSREAAALLTNDRALPWEPNPTERLLIPYYGALSYLRKRDYVEAAVEARRLSYHLESLEKDAADPRTRAFLRYFAGLVFEAAQETNDANVAYRNAALLLGDSLKQTPVPADSGDVVVVIEEGFVAHRYEQSVTVVLADYEADGLRDGDRQRRDVIADSIATRAFAQVAESALSYGEGPRLPRRHWYVPAPERPKEQKPKCTAPADSAATTKSSCDEGDDDDFYVLRLAWPAYHTMRRPVLSARVLVDSTAHGVPLFANISDAVVKDFERARLKMLARTIARGATKLALTKSAEKSVGKKHEDLGKALGVIANLGTAALEQADTRSWALLPGGIGVMRLRLPVGDHRIALEVSDRYAPHSNAPLDLGTIRVRAGELHFVTARTWQ